MSKFKKKSNTSQEIPTSALPDIIFMLLFFFMVTTVLRETSINVEQRIPKATELRKLQKKTLVKYLYVGKPKKKFIATLGTEPRIQANDVYLETNMLVKWVFTQRDEMPEVDKNRMTVALKVDNEVKMGLISDIQLELRNADARRLLYTSTRDTDR